MFKVLQDSVQSTNFRSKTDFNRAIRSKSYDYQPNNRSRTSAGQTDAITTVHTQTTEEGSTARPTTDQTTKLDQQTTSQESGSTTPARVQSTPGRSESIHD